MLLRGIPILVVGLASCVVSILAAMRKVSVQVPAVLSACTAVVAVGVIVFELSRDHSSAANSVWLAFFIGGIVSSAASAILFSVVGAALSASAAAPADRLAPATTDSSGTHVAGVATSPTDDHVGDVDVEGGGEGENDDDDPESECACPLLPITPTVGGGGGGVQAAAAIPLVFSLVAASLVAIGLFTTFWAQEEMQVRHPIE